MLLWGDSSARDGASPPAAWHRRVRWALVLMGVANSKDKGFTDAEIEALFLRGGHLMAVKPGQTVRAYPRANASATIASPHIVRLSHDIARGVAPSQLIQEGVPFPSLYLVVNGS